MLSQPPERPLPPSTALLWDLDNVTPRREHLISLAETLADLVAADSPRFAAAHRTTARRCGGLLAGTGIDLLSGGRRRNGADRVLLTQARTLRGAGITRFLLASNDHRFARIAVFADLHVLTLNPALLSVRLRERATSITVLDRDEAGWHTRESVAHGLVAPPAPGSDQAA